MAVPLSIIVLVSMMKDAYEDWKRHQSDSTENLKECTVYNAKTKNTIKKKW